MVSPRIYTPVIPRCGKYVGSSPTSRTNLSPTMTGLVRIQSDNKWVPILISNAVDKEAQLIWEAYVNDSSNRSNDNKFTNLPWIRIVFHSNYNGWSVLELPDGFENNREILDTIVDDLASVSANWNDIDPSWDDSEFDYEWSGVIDKKQISQKLRQLLRTPNVDVEIEIDPYSS